MTTLPTRTLGRTGLEVTTLGFGAMELRGGSNGPELTDDEAAALLNAVLDEGINFIDTCDRLWPQRGVDRQAHRAPARRVRARVEVRLRAERATRQRAHPHGREHPRRRRAQSASDGHRPPRSRAVPPQSHGGRVRTRRCARRALALRDEGKVRFVGVSATLPDPRRADRHGCVRRVPDPILGTAT